MYLGALGILLFLGLGVESCGWGILDGVVLTDVDTVEDTFEPGDDDVGNLELDEDKAGETGELATWWHW